MISSCLLVAVSSKKRHGAYELTVGGATKKIYFVDD